MTPFNDLIVCNWCGALLSKESKRYNDGCIYCSEIMIVHSDPLRCLFCFHYDKNHCNAQNVKIEIPLRSSCKRWEFAK